LPFSVIFSCLFEDRLPENLSFVAPLQIMSNAYDLPGMLLAKIPQRLMAVGYRLGA